MSLFGRFQEHRCPWTGELRDQARCSTAYATPVSAVPVQLHLFGAAKLPHGLSKIRGSDAFDENCREASTLFPLDRYWDSPLTLLGSFHRRQIGRAHV